MLAIETPYPFFPDTLDGSPLDDGQIFFGVANQNPETNPITVYWDAAGTQPVAQPAATLNGFIARNGTPALIYVSGDYSLTVRDRHGRLKYSLPSAAAYSIATFVTNFFATLATAAGGNNVGFNYAQNYVQGTVGAALVDEQVNAMWFVTSDARRTAIKNRTFANDNTAEAQAALTWAGPGRSVRFPGGWSIFGSLTRYPGQFIVGEGWQDKPGTFQVQGGSEIRQQTAGVALISSSAASDGVNAARGGLKDIALTFQGGSTTSTGDTTSTGFYANNNRQLRLENVFISGFGTGYELSNNCWQSRMDGVLVFDSAVCAFTHDAGGEDSTHINCIYRSYRAAGQGLHLKNQVQRVTAIGCDFSNNALGILLEQGDTNGNGTGTPLPMGITVIGGQFESCTTAGIQSVSSITSTTPSVIASFPSITVIDPRAYIATSPNTGQILIDAQKASRVELTGANSNGYSIGVQIGVTGSTPEVVAVHLDNPQGVWGTSEVACSTPNGLSKVYRRTGPRPSCTVTPTAMTTSTPTGLPFSVVLNDTESWYFLNGSTPTMRPRRGARTIFGSTIRFSAMAAGHLTIDVYKNGTKLVTVLEETVVSAALTRFVEWTDTPNGTTDYYNLVVTPPGSCTLDTTNSQFYAETCL